MKKNYSLFLLSICLFWVPIFAVAQSYSELIGVWNGTAERRFGDDSKLVFEIKKISENGNISATIKIGDGPVNNLKGRFETNSSFILTGNDVIGEVRLWIKIDNSDVFLYGGRWRFSNEFAPNIIFSLSKKLTDNQKSVLARASIKDLTLTPMRLYDQNKNYIIDKNESACLQFEIHNQPYSTSRNLKYQVRLNQGQVDYVVGEGLISSFERAYNYGVSFSFINEQPTTDSIKVYVEFILPYDTITRFVAALETSNNDFTQEDVLKKYIKSYGWIESAILGEYLHETQFSLRIKLLPDHTFYTSSDSIITSRGNWKTRIGYNATCEHGTQIFFETLEHKGDTNILNYRNQNGFVVPKSYDPKEPLLPLFYNEGKISQDFYRGGDFDGFSVGSSYLVKWLKFSTPTNDTSFQMFGKFISGYWGDDNFCFLFTEDGKVFFGEKGGLLHKGFWLWNTNCSLGDCHETFYIFDRYGTPKTIPCRIEHSKDPNTVTLINYDKSQHRSTFFSIVLKRGNGKSFFEDKEYENVHIASPLELLLRAAIFIDDNAIVGCSVCNGTGRISGLSCKKCGGNGTIKKKYLGN